MNQKISADYHLHTHHSTDSTAPMKDVIESAINKGLSEICFTDHLDLDYPEYEDLPKDAFNLNVNAYRKEFDRYKEEYKDRIKLKFGVEIGMQAHIAEKNSNFVKENDFDFVIASIHLVDRKDPFYDGFWDSDTVQNIFKRYFETTLENLKLFNDYNVLGHLDYLARYAPKGDTTYSYERFKEQIDAILEYLVKNDKGLDLNSKALYSDMPFPNPHPKALKRFRELGGKILTFGSDAHRAENLSACFDKTRALALEAGFTEYYTFEKRVPIAHKL